MGRRRSEARTLWIGLGVSVAVHVLVFRFPIQAPPTVSVGRTVALPTTTATMTVLRIAPVPAPATPDRPRPAPSPAAEAAPEEAVPPDEAPAPTATVATGSVLSPLTSGDATRRGPLRAAWQAFAPRPNTGVRVVLPYDSSLPDFGEQLAAHQDSLATLEQAINGTTSWLRVPISRKTWGASPGRLHLNGVTVPLCGGNVTSVDCGFGVAPGRRDRVMLRLDRDAQIRGQQLQFDIRERARRMRNRADRRRGGGGP